MFKILENPEFLQVSVGMGQNKVIPPLTQNPQTKKLSICV